MKDMFAALNLREISNSLRPLFSACAVTLLIVAAGLQAFAADDLVEKGRRIYQEGFLPSGGPLKGVRFDSKVEVKGSHAACINCHRRSGMGSVEGDITVPPVTGRFLFANPDGIAVANMDTRLFKRFYKKFNPYTEKTLADAMRLGINSEGHEMSAMMPRYSLSEEEMNALIAYLRQLSEKWSPGVTSDTIRFAAVITPGVEPERRKAFIDILQGSFAYKNTNTGLKSGKNVNKRVRGTKPTDLIYDAGRKWELDLWELEGKPETWAKQLEEHYLQNPVFAVAGGLSNTTWEPIHSFCSQKKLPCWFPSVDLPVQSEDFYSVYFSRGVALEADVLARHLLERKDKMPQRLVQIYRDDYVGMGAAQALSRALAGSGILLVDRVLRGAEPIELRSAMEGISGDDVVMFWLRPADLVALGNIDPPPSAATYFSARLAGGELGPFPAAWKKGLRLVYPYELPEKRQANMWFFHQWLKIRNLSMVDEPMQAEVYFAVEYLTGTLSEMLDNFYRDYLIERAENMLSVSEIKRATELKMKRAMLRLPAVSGKNDSTTIYPHLSLAPYQRFASKGGYIVRFSDAEGRGLMAESEWIVP